MAEPSPATGAPRSPGSGRAPEPDAATVRALLRAQAPALAGRPLRRGPTGWDNVHWLLGDDMAVRLPRRPLAVDLVANEADVLPRLAPVLPLAVPAPVLVGRPHEPVWPWPWTVVPWFRGERADLAAPPVDAAAHARTLGRFLAALHVPAPPDAPHNPYRSVPLGDRRRRFELAVAGIERQAVDAAAIAVLRRTWERGVAAPPWDGPPTWIHGDLHPGNQLVADGALVAVVDWGDVAAGDPAADLATAWWSLPTGVHDVLRRAHGGVDDATWTRAAAWAAVIAAFLLDQGPRVGDAAIVAMARRTVVRLGEAT